MPDGLGRRPRGMLPSHTLALLEVEHGFARRWGPPATAGQTLRMPGLRRRETGLDHLRAAVVVTAGALARLQTAGPGKG